jgi:hypothetical protein
MPPDERLHLRAHLAFLPPRGGIEAAEDRHRPATCLADLVEPRVHVRDVVDGRLPARVATLKDRAQLLAISDSVTLCALVAQGRQLQQGLRGRRVPRDGVVAFHHDRTLVDVSIARRDYARSLTKPT